MITLSDKQEDNGVKFDEEQILIKPVEIDHQNDMPKNTNIEKIKRLKR